MVTYEPNVPQASQTVAQTQPTIFGNFQFLNNATAGIANEHNFDITGASSMYHKKASMPNMALSPARPSGTNGVYFVSSGLAYYYDGTLNYNLNLVSAFANFTGNGAVGVQALRSSFNITDVNRTGTGTYTVTFANALTSANYVVSLTGMRSATGQQIFGQVAGNATYSNSVTTTTLKIQFSDEHGTLVNAFMGNLMVFGG